MPITLDELCTLLKKKESIVGTHEEDFLELLSTTQAGEKFLADPENNVETLDRLPVAEFRKKMIRLNADLFLAQSELKKSGSQAVVEEPVKPQRHKEYPYQFFLQEAEGRKRLIKHTLDRMDAINTSSIPDELKKRLLDYVREKAGLLYDRCIESHNSLSFRIIAFPDEQSLTTYFDRIIATFLDQEDNRVTEQTFMKEEDKRFTIQRDQETASTESTSMGQEDACAALLRNQEMDQAQQPIRIAQQYIQAAAMVQLREEAEFATTISLSAEGALVESAHQEAAKAIEQHQMEEEDKHSTVQRDQETASTESISMGQEDACAALLRNQEMDQAQQSIRMAQQYTQAAAMVRLREEAELAAAAIPLSEEDALAKAAYQEMTRAIECRQIEENRRFAEAERREKEQQEFLISEGQRLKREIEQYQIECSKNSILKKPNKKKADAYHKYYAAQELLDALAGKDRTYKNIEACKTALDTSYSQDLKNKKGISMTLGDVLCANNDSWGMSIWRWIKNLFHPRSLSPADYGKKLVEDTNRFFGNAKRQKQELINMPSIPAFRGPSSSPAA